MSNLILINGSYFFQHYKKINIVTYPNKIVYHLTHIYEKITIIYYIILKIHTISKFIDIQQIQ